jgi:hypothetical protein
MFTDQTDGRQTRSFGTTGSRQTKDVRARIQQVFYFYFFIFWPVGTGERETDGRSFLKSAAFLLFFSLGNFRSNEGI